MNDPAIRGLLRSVARGRQVVHVDVPRSVAAGIGQLRGRILIRYTVAGALAMVIGAGAVGTHVMFAQSPGGGRDVTTPVIHSITTTPAVTSVTVTETGTSTKTETETATSHSTATVTSTMTSTSITTTTETETTTETVPTTITTATTVTVPTTVVSTTTVTVSAPSSGGRCRPNPC